MKRIIIGRNPDHDFFLDEISVSRNHAELKIENGVITVYDLKSTNKTYVLRNSEKIPVDYADVQAEDSLYFGESGPHKVKDIIVSQKESTEIFSADRMLNQRRGTNGGSLNETEAGSLKKRCTSCGSVVSIDLSVCSHCGYVL